MSLDVNAMFYNDENVKCDKSSHEKCDRPVRHVAMRVLQATLFLAARAQSTVDMTLRRCNVIRGGPGTQCRGLR